MSDFFSIRPVANGGTAGVCEWVSVFYALLLPKRIDRIYKKKLIQKKQKTGL